MFTASISKSLIYKRDDYGVRFKIVSLYRQTLLKVPEIVRVGYKGDDKAEIYCIVEENKNNVFSEVESLNDYQFLQYERKTNQLSYHDSITYNFNLSYFYILEKGKYRFRAIYRPSIFNPAIPPTKTDWVYFEVAEDGTYIKGLPGY